MKALKLLVVVIVGCLLLGFWRAQRPATAQGVCPWPSATTAPRVRLWQYTEHGLTYARLTVHFSLADGFGSSIDSPLYFGRAVGAWYTTADPGQQETVCREQYWQLIEFSLGVLNEGERPFTYDNQAEIADYEAFLMSHHEWLVFLPLIESG